MKDLIDELRAVERRVGTDQLPPGEAKVVTLTRAYPAEVEDVWDAITDPERIARWFLPVSGDLREGGTYQLEGNAGGEIRVCEPPRRLFVTWVFGDPPPPPDSSFVDVTLERDGDGTRLTLVHTAVAPPEFWDTYGPGALGVGWDLALVGLVAHLSGVSMGTPEELDRDPAARDAMTASAAAWGDAHRASGEDPEVAARMAAATTGFYVPPLEDEPSG